MLHHSRDNQGFTITELLVSIGIMSVILAVVVSSQSTYTERAVLTNAADQLSLSATQAQVYGISVRQVSPGVSDFSAPYGLTAGLLGGDTNKIYLLIADRNGNGYYNGDWSCAGFSECLERVEITRGNYIESICVIRSSGVDQCNGPVRVDITFVRPKTDARIIFFDNDGQQYSLPNTTGARITLKSPSGIAKSVKIYITGQVSVQ